MTDMAENSDLRTHERGPGALLAAARAAQNLTIADVARQLKLSAHQVAALESDQFERLPGPVFVRGFVRNYARLLNMDPDRILGMMSDPAGADVVTAMPTNRGVPFSTAAARGSPRVLWLAALLAVVVLAAYEFYWRDRGFFIASPAPQPAPVTVAPAKDELPRAVVSAVATDALVPAPEPSAPPVAPVAPETALPPGEAPALVEAAASSDEAAPSSVTAAPARDEGELRFVFDRESWVQVRDADGKAIFTRLNAAGSEQRVAGKPPFTLVIGNAEGVRLSFNDRAIELGPHIVGEGVARFKLP